MLIKNATYLDENFSPVKGYIGIEDGTITYLSSEAPDDISKYGKIYSETAGKIFLPGFFNAHSHSAMYLLRGYGDGLPLSEWLNNRIFPFEDELTPDDIYKGTLAGAAEMIKFGIVSASDMYFKAAKMSEAFIKSGMKANVSACCSEFTPKDYREHKTYAETLEMKKNYHGYDDGRILIDYALHSEYTSNPLTARTIAETAAKEGLRMQVHNSETISEVEGCRERHDGMTPTKYLNSLNFFDIPVTAAHCVHLSDNDIRILKEKNVSVASCPKSNLKLASGICPAVKLINEGINVNIATDGVSSNNNTNMLEEIKIFSLLQKGITGDASAISPEQALYAATRAGAIAQGRDNCGLIKEGFRADIIAIDTTGINFGPMHNLLSNIIFSSVGTDVCLTICDGKILYENGEFKTVDIEKVRKEADDVAFRISDKLGG